jgi:hypothetical protein
MQGRLAAGMEVAVTFDADEPDEPTTDNPTDNPTPDEPAEPTEKDRAASAEPTVS